MRTQIKARLAVLQAELAQGTQIISEAEQVIRDMTRRCDTLHGGIQELERVLKEDLAVEVSIPGPVQPLEVVNAIREMQTRDGSLGLA